MWGRAGKGACLYHPVSAAIQPEPWCLHAVLQLLSSCLRLVKGTGSKEGLFLAEQMLCLRMENVWPGHMSRANKGPPGTEKHEAGLFLR